MADNKQNLTGDEKQTMSLLEEHIPKDMLGNVPKEGKGFINTFLGMGARFVNGFVGQKVSNAAVAFAGWKYKGAEQEKLDTAKANYALWGERVGRAAITSALRIRPVFGIVKDYFKSNSSIAQGFDPAIRAQGGGKSWFGGAKTDLEVVRHLRERNSQATSLRTKGFLQNFLSKLIPDLAMNELEMRINTLKEYYEERGLQDRIDDAEQRIKKQHHNHHSNLDINTIEVTPALEDKYLSGPQQRELNSLRADLKKIKTAQDKKGGVFAKRRQEQTANLDEWMNGQGWVPSYDGKGGDMANMLAEGDPTFSGDFNEDRGRGRVKFLQYIKPRLILLYEWITPSFLKGLAGDKFTPKATELLKKPAAGEMILELEKFLRDQPTPVRVSIGGKNCSLEDYIYEIFVQHRADMKRKPITDSVMIDQLRETCTAIADAMTDPNRQMHAQALAYLVDGTHGIWNISADSKLLGIKQDDELFDLIQSQIDARGLTLRPVLKKGEDPFVMAGIGKEEFAASWEKLEEQEKSAWSTFFRDELLLAVDVTKPELKGYRRQDNHLCFDVMEVILEETKKISQDKLENEAGVDQKVIKQAFKMLEGMRRDKQNFLRENRWEAMQVVAILGVKLDQYRDGFISEAIQTARKRNNKIEGFDHEEHEHDHEQEQGRGTSFRDSIEKERGEPGAAGSSKRVIESKGQRDAHRRGERSQVEEGVRHA